MEKLELQKTSETRQQERANQRASGGRTGAGGYKQAVSQLALVQMLVSTALVTIVTVVVAAIALASQVERLLEFALLGGKSHLTQEGVHQHVVVVDLRGTEEQERPPPTLQSCYCPRLADHDIELQPLQLTAGQIKKRPKSDGTSVKVRSRKTPSRSGSKVVGMMTYRPSGSSMRMNTDLELM
ncbi:hypothetical protein EYF80_012062 [Liparis tanakae]|uniref:Uncharacterized protein n=1 Tax=Liparis tanakae TaxID=230148 RepID=A0A4Z2IJW6_9TELE|nr:hypothetical protein EYF80_012062 [Liparis tanakae]